ncbi:hypothetical protein M9435_000223 [Picochlorum sp. BPE23]|nr:hypothetical protein M9435_000223 [Picochlorum sp. BPE23]
MVYAMRGSVVGGCAVCYHAPQSFFSNHKRVVFRGHRAIARATSDIDTAKDDVIPLELDSRGIQRMAYRKEGYSSWTWNSHNINYVQAGDSGPIVLLIHGFGASVYHWRYIIPGLSEKCRVYALDCLGFGWSDKALVDYEGYGIWTNQISDFIRDVIHRDHPGEKVVLAGNSLGGYNSLATAAAHPDLVESVILLNAAGRFDFSDAESEIERELDAVSRAMETVMARIKRWVVSITFLFSKQPARVVSVLKSVYHSHDNVDEELIQSILEPADDPRASEVFYRVITSRGRPINLLLDALQEHEMPLFLLWGSEDPWCVPANAARIESYYGSAKKKLIVSGHCPHDDTPEVVLNEMLEYLNVNV